MSTISHSAVRVDVSINGRRFEISIVETTEILSVRTIDSKLDDPLALNELHALSAQDAEDLAEVLLLYFGSRASVRRPSTDSINPTKGTT